MRLVSEGRGAERLFNKAKSLTAVMAAFALLAACGDQEVLLPGERLDVHGQPLGLDGAIVNRALPLPVPAARINDQWTHRNGNAAHSISHPALDGNLQNAWSVDIGSGNDRKHRISSDPVVANGRVFAMDSRSLVTAVSTAGELVWQVDLTPSSDRPDDASGGGLAIGGGTLFATTGFGELIALDAATGERIWSQDLDSAPSGPPTVSDGVVYVATRNSLGWAIDTENGRILWQVLGAPSESGVAGGSSPAIAGSLAIFPLPSGQMIAAVTGPGTQAWVASVAGQRPGRAFSRFSDLTGDPVVRDNVVYAGNHSGRAAAFSAVTGQSIWRIDHGALNPMWIDGGSVFLVSDENQLIRLDAATGDIIWLVDLPFFTANRLNKRETTYSHFGPVLAGGRLLIASDDDQIRQFDPVTGGFISSIALPKGAASGPVVAGGTLYVVTEDGALHAFR